MILKIFWTLLAITFPWLVLLFHDNPGGAFIALIMQATVFGWVPATIWALRTIHTSQSLKRKTARKTSASK